MHPNFGGRRSTFGRSSTPGIRLSDFSLLTTFVGALKPLFQKGPSRSLLLVQDLLWN